MIYKYTSVERIISKVYTDLDLNEGDHKITDMIEWAGEALEKIGAIQSLITKVTGLENEPVLVLKGYQARLPHGFHRIVQAAYAPSINGPWSAMRAASGSFDHARPNRVKANVMPAIIAPYSELVQTVMTLYTLSYVDAIAKLNAEPNIREYVTGLLTMTRPGRVINGTGQTDTNDITYIVQGNFIKTNIESGYLQIAYLAMPIDIKGYPLIPDDQGYIDAIYWYIVNKLYYPKWRDGRIRDAVYQHSNASWNYYCKQAYGNAMMPDTDQMEAIKNSWVRLVPEMNEHSTFFTSLGQAQVIHNANTPGLSFN